MLKPLVPGEGVSRDTGKYVVHGLLGQGGVGAVHRGHDSDLGQDVAMKFLHEKYKDQPALLHRFIEEAQIGGQLQHPGIVPVYELGMSDGRPFFTMKMVKGQTLAKKLAERASPSHDRRTFLGIFEDICQTMAYAHARGVVHRDLKPANVMIGSFGEVQVVDWGMGKVLQQGGVADERIAAERQSQLSVIATVRSAGHGTQSVMGSVMGTPAYMPPEQARGDVEQMDERSDVFALGAILCEILTGEPPYVGEAGELIAMAALARLDNARARLEASGADAAIVELAVQCMAPAPAARPQSASDVAERVSAYLGAVEDRARQAELRATEARYRNRMTLLAAAGVLLVVALGAGTWIWLDAAARERRDQIMARVSAARGEAQGALGRAEASQHEAQLWTAALASARQVVALSADEAVDDAVRAEAVATLEHVKLQQRAAQAEAARLARDAAMLERLEVLRIPVDEDLQGWNSKGREARRLDRAYAEAFADYLGGTPLFEGEARDVAARLQKGDIHVELAASLDHWGLIRGSREADATGTARIRALAVQLDPEDPWRNRLRSLLPDAAKEGTGLLELAAQADFAALGEAGCRVLAEALWRAGEQEAALRTLRRGQQLYPQDVDLCFTLARALEQLPDPRFEAAFQTLRIARALRPQHAGILLHQGVALRQLGRLAEAEAVFRRLSTREGWLARSTSHLGVVLKLQGKMDEAIACFRRAIEIDPELAHAHGSLGIAFHDRRQLDEAIRCYRRAVGIAPTCTIHVNLGSALHDKGELDEAIACYRRAIELYPEDAIAHGGPGHALVDTGKPDEAIESLRRAIDLDPDGPAWHLSLGRALQAQGKPDEAIPRLRRAIEIDADDKRAHGNLGIALFGLGRIDEATGCFRRVVEIDPGDALGHVKLAEALQAQGKPEQAIASYRAALEIQPRHLHALRALAQALRKQGKFDEAVSTLRRAVELDPVCAPAHYNLGTALAAKGRLEDALASYGTALEIWSTRKDSFAVEWADRARAKIADLSESIGRQPALLQVLTNERAPASREEFDAAARLGYDQGRYWDVVTLTETTLADAPELVGSGWGAYNPACAAALLAADAEAGLSSGERARLRGLARSWLLREVSNWRALLGSADAAEAGEARKRLAHALADPDLASVRGPKLDALPEVERTTWHEVWVTIENALQKEQR